MLKHVFYRDWHLPSNGDIAIGVIRDIDVHFHGQSFSCDVYALQNIAGSGCLRQICLDSHGSRHGDALVRSSGISTQRDFDLMSRSLNGR